MTQGQSVSALRLMSMALALALAPNAHAQSPTAASNVRTAPPVTIVDDQGRVLGRYGGLTGDTHYGIEVFVDTPGGTVSLRLDRDYGNVNSPLLNYAIGGQGVYFSGPNCTGTAYVEGVFAIGALPASVLADIYDGSGARLYFADSMQPEAPFQLLSTMNYNGCSAGGPYLFDAFRVSSPPIDLAARVTPPFHVR
jgi:hypothetical protein